MIPYVREGDPITAHDFNRLVDAANRSALSVSQNSGLTIHSSPEGYTLSTAIPLPFWAKITGPISSGKYPFTKQYEAAGGTWTDAPVSGEAYEVSGNTSVTSPTYVKMWQTSTGEFRFLAGTC